MLLSLISRQRKAQVTLFHRTPYFVVVFFFIGTFRVIFHDVGNGGAMSLTPLTAKCHHFLDDEWEDAF